MHRIKKNQQQYIDREGEKVMVDAFLLNHVKLFKLWGFFRNPMCGKCIKNGAGSFSLLVIASENNMKTSSTKQR